MAVRARRKASSMSEMSCSAPIESSTNARYSPAGSSASRVMSHNDAQISARGSASAIP